jgi:sugar lactone lactonase YvrE
MHANTHSPQVVLVAMILTAWTVITPLAANCDAPEGVVWSSDDHLYITESNVQVATDPWQFRSGISRVSQGGDVTSVLATTLAWCYSGITLGADGLIYVANEASGVGTTDSIFRVDPATGARTLFTSDLIAPEGLRFSSDSGFPLLVAEEDAESGSGQISVVRFDGSHNTLCSSFHDIEDIVLDSAGNLYVSEDTSGLVIKIARTPSHRWFMPAVAGENAQ